MSTAPLSVASTESISASVVEVMVLSATDTFTAPETDTLLLDEETAKPTEVASAVMLPLSVALTVRSPARTESESPPAVSVTRARVSRLISLRETATLALTPTDAPLWEVETLSETPKAVESMEAVLSAVIDTSCVPALIEVSSDSAMADAVTSFSVTAIPRPTPTLAPVPLPTFSAMPREPVVASMRPASAALIVTGPVAVMLLCRTEASTEDVTSLPEPDPAPDRASVPLPDDSDPETAKVKASISEVDSASVVKAAEVTVAACTSAVVVLVMWFTAMAAPMATAPALLPLLAVETASAPAPASALIFALSSALTDTAPPAALTTCTPEGFEMLAMVVASM